MKKLLTIFMIFFVMTCSVFAMEYPELKNDLEEWAGRTSRAHISREIKVNYATFSDFMKGKTSTSPTVLAQYRKYIENQTPPKQKIIPVNLLTQAVPPKSQVKIKVLLKAHVQRDLNKEFEGAVVNPLSLQEKKKEVITKEIITKEVITLEGELLEIAQVVSQQPYAPSKLKASYKEVNALGLSCVLIPARGYRDAKDAKGIFYDHFVFQRATSHETRSAVAEGQTYPFSDLKSYIKGNPYGLRFGEDWESKKIPQTETFLDDSIGLLVIPGRIRDAEYDGVRAKQEKDLIREALKRGQPILSLCAGAWRLWDCYRQLLSDPTYKITVREGLRSTEGHVYSRMMNFSESTGKVVYNIDMHEIRVEEDSLLASVLRGKGWKKPFTKIFKVNSVHWKSVDPGQRPSLLKISAVSLPSAAGVNVPRLGLVFPEQDVPEAFETLFGSPFLGIQWHPEAYNPGDSSTIDHLNILRYMVKAGDAYRFKRNVINDLHNRFKAH